jgi:tetratricopeptide (TPR) repeat protein
MRHDLVIPERDNIRAALTWARDKAEWELGLDLFVALENYWATNAAHEGVEWAQTLLSSAPAESSRLRFRALRVQGGMENILGRHEISEQLWEQALAVARELGDELGVGILLHRLATAAVHGGEMERVQVLAEESLAAFRSVGGFAKGEAQALTSLAEVRQANGDLEGALELLEESRRLATTSGFRWWQAGTSARIAALLLDLGRLDDARVNAEQALALSNSMHDRSAIVYELGLLAEIHAQNGESERAGTLWGATEVEEVRAPIGSWLHGPVRFQPSITEADAGFERALAAGRAMELDEAVAIALDGDAT